ncbi:MAG TPA: KpsF/GutQ family sugar-phosphate isomerase [Chthonomonadales bacterium]|nr:KpsF/GutQ family sugar-phosphate isomerase [Chthonomonadales bacterium]
MEDRVLARGRAVLDTEAAAIQALSARLDDHFVQAVRLVLGCRGRIVCTGVGKAGAVARKVAASLASTGSPALYLHPAEGQHGDLGVVTADDLVIAFSYSGESDEVVRLLPSLARIGATLVAVAGNPGSSLSTAAHLVLDVGVAAEACPLGLAPTTSTTAMLALGDALAMAAMDARGFTREEFAVLHPAGALGRRLTLRVSDVMRSGEQMAVSSPTDSVRDVLFAITRAGAGAAFVVDSDGRLAGMITDGDVRRALLRNPDALDRKAADVMNRNPLVVAGNPLAVEALSLLQESPRRPGEAPVVDGEGRPVGVIMLKDLLRSGVV